MRRKRLEEELADCAAMTESVGVMKNAARTAVFEEIKAYNRQVRSDDFDESNHPVQ